MKKILLSLLIFLCITSSLIAAPRAIVFDFGGVLTREPKREAVIHFIQESLHLSREEFEKINKDKHLAIKQGKSDEEFWLSYAKDKGCKLSPNWREDFRLVMKDAIGVNKKMYALVEELQKQKIQVALLSNIDERLSKIVRSFGLYEPFDPCLLSCEIGFEKPSLKAYEVLLKKLNLPAKEILFIDDHLENIEAAKKSGLDVILFESEDQLRLELSKRGIAS